MHDDPEYKHADRNQYNVPTHEEGKEECPYQREHNVNHGNTTQSKTMYSLVGFTKHMLILT